MTDLEIYNLAFNNGGYEMDLDFEITNFGQDSIFEVLIDLKPCSFLPNTVLTEVCRRLKDTTIVLAPNESILYTWTDYSPSPLIDGLSFEDGIEVCVTGLSPNGQYDQDYSNNSTCEMLQLDTRATDVLDSDLIKIFPNPATENIKVEILDDDFKAEYIQVYSIAGVFLMEQKVTQDQAILMDVSNLNSGQFLMKIMGEDKRRITKLFAKL